MAYKHYPGLHPCQTRPHELDFDSTKGYPGEGPLSTWAIPHHFLRILSGAVIFLGSALCLDLDFGAHSSLWICTFIWIVALGLRKCPSLALLDFASGFPALSNSSDCFVPDRGRPGNAAGSRLSCLAFGGLSPK